MFNITTSGSDIPLTEHTVLLTVSYIGKCRIKAYCKLYSLNEITIGSHDIMTLI